MYIDHLLNKRTLRVIDNIGPRRVKGEGWKGELGNFLWVVVLLFFSYVSAQFYISLSDNLFAQFFYAEETEGVITHVETVSSRSSVRNKHLEIEYVNAEGKTRGFWIKANTEKDVGDRIKVRYWREGGEVVAETLPDLIVHVFLVIFIFGMNLLLSFVLFLFILWYKRRVEIVIRKGKIRLKRRFGRKKYIGRE